MNNDAFNIQAQATLATRNGDPAVAAEVPSLAYRPVVQRLFVDVAAAAPVVAAVAAAAAAAAPVAAVAAAAAAVVAAAVVAAAAAVAAPAAAVCTAEDFDRGVDTCPVHP